MSDDAGNGCRDGRGTPRRRWLAGGIAAGLALGVAAGEPRHGFSYFGDLKYPKGVARFDYANPDAPKGGAVRMPLVGTFNNLNPFVDKGIAAAFVGAGLGSLLYDSLMIAADDELASYYCRLAASVAVADDYSWVEYVLRDDARWHDGTPVTVADALWTFETIKTKGSASARSSYRHIESMEQTGPWSLRFRFDEDVEKTPQLVVQTAGFAPLPRHYWAERRFDATTLEPPLGNGPYRIAKVDAGHKVVLERVADYWGRNLGALAGHFNFDRIDVVYFMDAGVMLQALRAGVVDYYRDQDESTFATAYDFPGYRKGLFKKETYALGASYGMHYALVFNTRRPLFQDIRVREALTLAYNFEWANRVYWHGGMDRNNSYFARSGMQAKGLPSAAELALLRPFGDAVPARVFTQPVALPRNAAFGRNRATLRRADALLREAGWVVRDLRRVHARTGEPLAFDMVVSRSDHERMLVPYADNLARLGVQARLRKVESNLLVNRLRNYDFDTTMRKIYTFRIPYPERMRGQFTSRYADLPNMTNYAGISNPVVDALVEQVVGAASEARMNAAGRALDRVLHWSFYMIPDGHPKGRHLAYWDRFGHPPLGAEHMFWTGFPHLWWFDAERSKRVDAGLAALAEGETP